MIEAIHLVSQHQTLVDDHARRKAGDVTVLFLRQSAFVDGACVQFANDVQFPFQHVGWRILAAGDECLANHRFDVARRATQYAVFDRHVAPPQKHLPLFGDDSFELFDAETAFGLVGRQEDHTDSVVAARRQLDSLFRGLGLEEFVRHLRQNPGAVAGQGVAAAGAAVRQIDQDLLPPADDLVALFASNIDDEAHAAGIVLKRGIVESLPCGGSDWVADRLHGELLRSRLISLSRAPRVGGGRPGQALKLFRPSRVHCHCRRRQNGRCAQAGRRRRLRHRPAMRVALPVAKAR